MSGRQYVWRITLKNDPTSVQDAQFMSKYSDKHLIMHISDKTLMVSSNTNPIYDIRSVFGDVVVAYANKTQQIVEPIAGNELSY